MKRTGLLLALLLGVLAMVVAACGDDSGDSGGGGGGGDGGGEPIKIGYLASTTGFCSAFAEDEVRGAELAVDTLNAQGGVDGRPIELVVRDDQATPNVAVRQARDLVLNEQIKFLAGTCSSAVGLAVRKSVADPSKVFYAAPVADDAVFEGTGDGSYVFGTLATTSAEGTTVANYVKSRSDVKKLSFIGEDYSYSQQVFKAFEGAVKDGGPQILSEDYATVSDYAPFINKILSKKPDFVFSNLITSDLATFVKQAKPLGLFDQLGEGNFIGFLDLTTLLSLGKDAPIGQYGYTYYPEPYLYPGKVMDAMAEKYKASTGRVATGAVGDGYNQVWMIAQAIEKAGEADPAKAAEALAGSTIDFVQGKVTIRDCDHLPVTPVAIGKIAAPNDEFDHPHMENPEFVDTKASYPAC
jgi:ABC-type branched-subunit amino acid transport system substrate-binding protein